MKFSFSDNFKKLRTVRRLAVGCVLLAAVSAASHAQEPPGKATFEQRCKQCHALPDPKKLTDEQWVVRLDLMAPMAGLRPGEKSDVLQFLQSHNEAAVTVASMAREKRLFEEKCGLCHTTDRVFLVKLTTETRKHVIDEMRERAPDWISEKEAHEIVEYLVHGAPEAKKPVRKEVKGGSAVAFRERCSACHTLERVYLELEKSKDGNKAPTWLHIVKRMREKAPEWIDEKEAREIVTYLKTLKPVVEKKP